MPRLNFAEPAVRAHLPSARAQHATGRPGSLSDADVVRLSALGLSTLEVAHDLGNLLQVISSAIHLIDQNLPDQRSLQIRRLISEAKSAVERGTKLSRRILDSGRPRPIPSGVVYLDTLLTEMQQVIILAAGPTVKVELQCGDHIPAIACQRADLENAILNLVVNARDAMSQGGHLTLSVEREMAIGQKPRPDIILSVSDTGCGMSQTVAAQAFKPFFTTKSHDRGTGLGLAMVGALAGRLGGSADIVSLEGQGTTLILRLPSCGG